MNDSSTLYPVQDAEGWGHRGRAPDGLAFKASQCLLIYLGVVGWYYYIPIRKLFQYQTSFEGNEFPHIQGTRFYLFRASKQVALTPKTAEVKHENGTSNGITGAVQTRVWRNILLA